MDKWDGNNRRNAGHPFELNGGRGWVLSLAIFLLIQTGTAFFWAGKMTQDMETIKSAIIEIKGNIPPAWFEAIVTEHHEDIEELKAAR